MRIAIGTCELDVDARQLSRAGAAVHLSPKAFDLLAYLVAQRPRAVPRQELYDRLWPETFVVEANLPVLVREIRVALGDEKGRWIRTVHRHGYACAPDEPAAPSVPAAPHTLLREDREFPLSQSENLVGRDADAAVRLASTSVSRRHAVITIDGESATVVDLDSKNGTFVDGECLTAPRLLRDGAVIRFGTVEMIYRWSAAHRPTETMQ